MLGLLLARKKSKIIQNMGIVKKAEIIRTVNVMQRHKRDIHKTKKQY